MADFAHCEDASALQDYWAFRSEVGLSLQDAVHGTVQLGPTARLLCDSLPVQRLRGLSQLGATRWAFPTAEHSRFGHCAGTAHLAVAAARHLAGTGLRVTPGQVELLEAAALCHDVGHGPFSHTFESCFLPAVRGNHCWHHEDMSARLLEYAVDQQALDISKEQLHLMHAIISGSSSSSNGNSSNGCAGISGHWGDSDSSWRLQIVANATNGVDVDKVDYLRRDALMTGVGAAYDFTPLLSNCRVIEGELCFHSSQQPALVGLFAARAAMHSSVYQHRSARAAELMVVDALLAADPVLHISKHVDDPEAFLTLDDSLLGEIKRAARRDPQCPHLAAAAAILRRLDTRQLYAWAAEAAVPEQFVLERGAAACSLPAADVIAHQDSSLGVYLSEGDLRLSNMSIDCGKGIHDPLDYTRLYSSNSSSSSSSTWLASQGIARPASFMQRKVRVYLARPCQGSDRGRYLRAVQAAFERAVAARFGSGATICCCADGSSSARLDPWQQQQQQSCVTTQPLAAAAAGFNAQQHMIQGTAGLVSWPPSPQQQKQQQQQRQRQRLLQAELADDPMSGFDVEADGEGCSVGQQQQGCSLQDGPVVKVWSEES
uniref:HD/PDEase domain-containing protein n=1 Tax=Tetradesmus obliquus TaxID=3088 RepID=A0A383VVF6_TETOB|eukprot:jgi/Sobl393_1/3142/SZX68843.1